MGLGRALPLCSTSPLTDCLASVAFCCALEGSYFPCWPDILAVVKA